MKMPFFNWLSSQKKKAPLMKSWSSIRNLLIRIPTAPGPGTIWGWYITGWGGLRKPYMLMNTNKYELALEAYQNTINCEGINAENSCYLAASYEKLNQIDMAFKYFKKSAKLDPEYDDAWFGLGMCMLKRNKFFEAIHYFKKALNLTAENANYWVGLAEAEYNRSEERRVGKECRCRWSRDH